MYAATLGNSYGGNFHAICNRRGRRWGNEIQKPTGCLSYIDIIERTAFLKLVNSARWMNAARTDDVASVAPNI